MRNRFQIYQKLVSDSAIFCILLAKLKPVRETIKTWSGDGFANETGNCARVYVELFVVFVAEITTKNAFFISDYRSTRTTMCQSNCVNIITYTNTYSTSSILKYFDRYVINYERGTF